MKDREGLFARSIKNHAWKDIWKTSHYHFDFKASAHSSYPAVYCNLNERLAVILLKTKNYLSRQLIMHPCLSAVKVKFIWQ